MDILNKIFNFSKDKNTVEPNVIFGRYTDAYKEKEKYQSWDDAMQSFEKENFLDSYEQFFFYLKDDDLKNLEYKRSSDRIEFSIYQGSKLIKGRADLKSIRAEAKIARTDTLNIGVLRRLLELNYTLKYCRYALDEDNSITMLFHSKTLDASPYKLYYALKELAINADKQDDILEGEFKNLIAVNKSHVRKINLAEKEIKYNYLQSTINDILNQIDTSHLDLIRYPGAESYIILDAVYKMDYLLKPEGFTMEAFEKMHRKYFQNNGEVPAKKNNRLRKKLKKVQTRSAELFHEELYEVVSTFGITMPSGHEQFVEFCKNEIGNISWYINNNHYQIAQAIPGYIVGYSLFNYSLPVPIKTLLHLYYRVVEQDYFKELGYSKVLVKNDKPLKSKIISEVNAIVSSFKNEYGKLDLNTGGLKFNSILDFSLSYLLMIQNIPSVKSNKIRD